MTKKTTLTVGPLFLALIVLGGCALLERPEGYVEVRVILHKDFLNSRRSSLQHTPFLLTGPDAYITTIYQGGRGEWLIEGRPTRVSGETISRLQEENIYMVNVEGVYGGRIRLDKELFKDWEPGKGTAVIHLNDDGTIGIEWE